MRSFFVVFLQPLFSLLFDLVQGLKHEHVEHRFAIATVESFNEAVLHRPTWLDELELHVVLFGPISQCCRAFLGRYPVSACADSRAQRLSDPAFSRSVVPAD